MLPDGSPRAMNLSAPKISCLGYANHVCFVPTVFDLKIIFGESRVGEGQEMIEQHTEITISVASRQNQHVLPWHSIDLPGGVQRQDINEQKNSGRNSFPVYSRPLQHVF